MTLPILIVGASTRAAAFAAMRAELDPWCADFFMDVDLQARCHTLPFHPSRYSNSIREIDSWAPDGPWMYTGGLENRPKLVDHIARLRPLWGNDSSILAVARSPLLVFSLCHAANLPSPAVFLEPKELPREGRWLMKPLAGAGGAGIQRIGSFDPEYSPARDVYFQEYIEGPSHAAAYIGDGKQARLLGVTRQLVGESWLHAAPFHYCGSIGPLALSNALTGRLEALGNILVQGSGMRGLFGVDFILQDEVPWPVEINPRYSASMELLDYGYRTPLMATHREVFDPNLVVARSPDRDTRHPVVARSHDRDTHRRPLLAKAILFARVPLVFPATGPWLATLPSPVTEMPAFADIPRSQALIPAARPILTFFSNAFTIGDCVASLQRVAYDLDQILYPS